MSAWWRGVALAACMAAVGTVAASPKPGAADRRLHAAADYLHRAILPSGRFVYLRHLDHPSQSGDHRYNLLRHAGTLFALADYHARFAPDQPHAERLRRATRYLVDCCIAPVPELAEAMAVWSEPAVIGRPGRPRQAKLGGTGLALVALISVDAVTPGVTEQGLWQALGEFLLFMQNSDGGFASKYLPARGGRDDSWVSLYYPGEAALGLIMLFERDGDVRWLKAAIDALRQLARTREQQAAPPADHWALMATARLLRQPRTLLEAAAPAALPWSGGLADGHGLHELLVRHAERIVDAMLAEQASLDGLPCREGGFNAAGRVAPTATRLEGLLAARGFLPIGERREAVDEAVARGMVFLMHAEIREGELQGGFPRVAPGCVTGDRRAGEVRIDYVQHALSAYLRAYRLRAEPRPANGEGTDYHGRADSSPP